MLETLTSLQNLNLCGDDCQNSIFEYVSSIGKPLFIGVVPS